VNQNKKFRFSKFYEFAKQEVPRLMNLAGCMIIDQFQNSLLKSLTFTMIKPKYVKYAQKTKLLKLKSKQYKIDLPTNKHLFYVISSTPDLISVKMIQRMSWLHVP